MLLALFFIVAAVVLLYFGAELSLEASEVFGKKLGLSPLVIGMLLVGLGTSLPELFVAHIASFQGKGTMALGTLVGSNIANATLILPLAGLLTSMSLGKEGMVKQLFIHFALCLALAFLLVREKIDTLSSAVLLLICMSYLIVIFLDMRKSNEGDKEEKDRKGNLFLIVKMLIGFTMLYFGGELLVIGGTDLGLAIGMSEYLISAIFIAFGTSFPELVTVLLASVKKKDTDLIIGNIIGSNLFNCSLILGTIGFYSFSIKGNYNFEIMSLVFCGSFLLLGGLFKKDFFRLASILFLSIYSVMVLVWTGIIDRGIL